MLVDVFVKMGVGFVLIVILNLVGIFGSLCKCVMRFCVIIWFVFLVC